MLHDVEWLQKRHVRPGLQAIVMVESSREVGRKTEKETGFYLTSLVNAVALLGPIVRRRYAIENRLHWVMDMDFRTIKHIAHNRLRAASGMDSLRLRRKIAAWDDDFRASLVAV